jgi:hypothetical protein
MNAVTQHEAGPLMLVEPDEPERRQIAERQPQGPAVPESSPAGMMLALMSKGASLADVSQMMDLQERWEKREAEKAYNAAFAAFTSEKVTVMKRKRVEFTTRDGDTTSYKHAELADVTDAVDGPLGKHGFGYSWKTRQEKDGITVTCTLKHALGHSEQVSLTAPPDNSGKKNAIQQISSTITYLERTTLKLVTGVSEKGEDNDGADAGGGRGEWLENWLKRISQAPNVGELRRLVAEAIAEAKTENDQDAEDRFLVAQANKMALVKPANHKPAATRSEPRHTAAEIDNLSEDDIPH